MADGDRVGCGRNDPTRRALRLPWELVVAALLWLGLGSPSSGEPVAAPDAAADAVLEPAGGIRAREGPRPIGDGCGDGCTFRTGASENMDLWRQQLPLPTATGRRVVVSSVEGANAAIGTLAPGDELVLADGDYRGWVTFGPGTGGAPGRPVVVRAARAHAAVFRAGGFRFTEAGHVVVRDVAVRGATNANVFDIGRGAHHIRISSNRIEDSGDASPDGSYKAIFKVETNPWRPDGSRLGIRDAYITIDNNTVVRPRQVVLGLDHEVRHTLFSHNVVQGPHGMPANAYNTYVIKSGSGADYRARTSSITYTVYQYNTVAGWGRAQPQAFDEKNSAVLYRGNDFREETLTLRLSNASTVAGNRIGSLWVGGRAHLVERNLVWTATPWNPSTPPTVALYGDGACTTSCTGWLTWAVQDTVFRGNVIVSGGRPGTASHQERTLGSWESASSPANLTGNRFEGNRFVRVAPFTLYNDSGSAFTGYATGTAGVASAEDRYRVLTQASTWSNNAFWCTTCPGGGQVRGVTGSNGNVLTPMDPLDPPLPG